MTCHRQSHAKLWFVMACHELSWCVHHDVSWYVMMYHDVSWRTMTFKKCSTVLENWEKVDDWKSVKLSNFLKFQNKLQNWKDLWRPQKSHTFGRTASVVMPRHVQSFFGFTDESKHFLSEWSSPLGLVKFYFWILGQSPPKFSKLLLFPWIAKTILICCTKGFNLLHFWSVCLCCPDQTRPFSQVKENWCIFICEKICFFFS